ncbi:MAG: hypothetical protein ACI9YH_003314 [Colwellia sp.]|jgi:hypothetical protein
MSKDVKVLVGELLDGNEESGKEISNQISQNPNKATLFFVALEKYCEQENKIAANALEIYKDLQVGLTAALDGEHSDETKAEILRTINKVIDSISESVNKDDKRKKFNKYMIIGGLAVASIIAYKYPKVSKELLSKVVKMI